MRVGRAGVALACVAAARSLGYARNRRRSAQRPACFRVATSGKHTASGMTTAEIETVLGSEDVRHLLEVGLGVLFWLTPIVYEAASLPDSLRLPILLTPVSPFIASPPSSRPMRKATPSVGAPMLPSPCG